MVNLGGCCLRAVIQIFCTFVFGLQLNDLQLHCLKEGRMGEYMNFQVVVLVSGASKQLFPLVSKVHGECWHVIFLPWILLSLLLIKAVCVGCSKGFASSWESALTLLCSGAS